MHVQNQSYAVTYALGKCAVNFEFLFLSAPVPCVAMNIKDLLMLVQG